MADPTTLILGAVLAILLVALLSLSLLAIAIARALWRGDP